MKRIDRLFLLAARAGDLQQVKGLISRGADVNARIDSGEGYETNAFRLAAANFNLDVCHYLLDAGIDHTYYDAGLDEYPNLLAAAAWDDSLCRRLIELGLDPGDYDGKSESLFVIASRHANLDLMKHLYAIGVDIGEDRFHGTGKSKYSFSPLLFSAGRHDVEMTRFLLEIGCSLKPTFHKGITPLHAACLNSKSNCLARPPGNARHVFNLLLSYGADLHVRDQDGNTPLHYGCGIDPFPEEGHRGNRAIISVLLDMGADPHLQNTAGKRPVDTKDTDLADFARGYQTSAHA